MDSAHGVDVKNLDDLLALGAGKELKEAPTCLTRGRVQGATIEILFYALLRHEYSTKLESETEIPWLKIFSKTFLESV